MNADNQGFDWAHSKVVGRRFVDCGRFIQRKINAGAFRSIAKKPASFSLS
jgi:hypothetical protein